MSSGCLLLLMVTAQIFLHGASALALYWLTTFRSRDGEPFAWRGEADDKDGDNTDRVFNLHPLLMVCGFIYFLGQGVLMFSTCCCSRSTAKLLHATCHVLAVPCLVLALMAAIDSHNAKAPDPVPNFYSIHAWMGLATVALFAMQFLVGLVCFAFLLCCAKSTWQFRAALAPVHAAFGAATFALAVATACSGLTEKAYFTLSLAYQKWVPYLRDPAFNRTAAVAGLSSLGPEYTDRMFAESLTLNALAAALVGAAVTIIVVVVARGRGGACGMAEASAAAQMTTSGRIVAIREAPSRNKAYA